MPNHDDYEYYKKHGVCVWCQRREAEPGKTLCYECAEKDRKRAHDKYYANHEKSLENNRRGYARRREKRKALGICTRCGSRKAMPGHTLCLECNIKMNRYARERKRKNGAIPKEARMEGLCIRCGAPVVPGKKLCRRCYEASCENIAKGRAIFQMQGRIHPWRDERARVKAERAGRNEGKATP